MLIGMDIIKFGDLAISKKNNNTIFSFAIPPFDNLTDLLEKANKVNKNININKTEAKNILTDIFNLKSYIEKEIKELPTRFNIVDSIVGSHKETSNTKLLGSFLDCIFEKDYKFANSLLEYIKKIMILIVLKK